MPNVFFLFVGEGPSDDPLVRPLEKLCVLCGADEALGSAVDWRLLDRKAPKAVGERVRAALEVEPAANLVFVHRDADAADGSDRRVEIEKAFARLALEIPGIPVVPIQETEAWLLLDEAEIRRVAENPRGRARLSLPPVHQIEATKDPKGCLAKALNLASELQGRRLKRFQRSLPLRHRLLLDRLDPEGPVTRLSAWQHLRADLKRALQGLEGRR